MAEIKNDYSAAGGFKEACCIDAARIYDSCCDKDCADDLRCYFTEEGQNAIIAATNVKLRKAEVINVYINVEPVNFNRGFYACDLSFLFLVDFDVYSAPTTCPVRIQGVTCFNKRVILYGSDGNVKVFSNAYSPTACDLTADTAINTPRCVVQAVDPIPLGCCVGALRDSCECLGITDARIADILGGPIVTQTIPGAPTVYVTLGIFTVIQLIRNVQMLIPVYDYCIPEKQCNDTTDRPCDVFKKIKFPTEDFFPPISKNDCDFACSADNEY